MILLGIEDADGEEDIDWLCRKIVSLRIFDDADGVMNIPITEVADSGILLVYFADVTEERIDLTGLFDGPVYGGWFNPSDGSLEIIHEALPVTDAVLQVRNPGSVTPDAPDRVLILAADPSNITVPAGIYGDKEGIEELKKVFEW